MKLLIDYPSEESMKFQDIRSILVIKLRHIGDVLLTYPVFTNLKKNFPNAKIYALVNKGTEEMLTGHPCIDDIITVQRRFKHLFKKNLMLPIEIRQKNIDMTIDLTSGDRSAIISYLSGARYRIAYDPDNKGFLFKKYLYTNVYKNQGTKHTVEKNLNLLKLAGINVDNYDVNFHINDEDIIKVKHILMDHGLKEFDKLVHIHPTSRWLFKCWDENNWVSVIDFLIENNFKVCITSSNDEKEKEITKRISANYDTQDVINLSGKITLKQVGAISKMARFFIGVDTAPMHIAAALKTPVIALFGAGVNEWRPYGDGHFVIYKPQEFFKDISREERIKINLGNIKPNDVIGIIQDNFL